jgi:hypothetical protein
MVGTHSFISLGFIFLIAMINLLMSSEKEPWIQQSAEVKVGYRRASFL